MSFRYQAFDVSGVANTLTLDDGLTSTEQEQLEIVSVLLSVDEIVGNDVEGWISQTRHVQIDDAVLDTNEADGTNQYRSTSKINELPIERALRPGETFQIGIRCGGTATDVAGAYKYRVTNE